MLAPEKPCPNSHPRIHSLLGWSARALFAAGLILVGFVALVLVQAKLYDSHAKHYVATSSLEKERLNPQSEKSASEATLTEGEILGHLEIPRRGVSAAVLQGTTTGTLRHGVGHIPGTALPGMPGNIAIAGHRDTFFRALKGIHQGDEIELKTANTSTQYLVDWTKVVLPEDNWVLGPTRESTLTLVTCYPFYFIGAAPKR